MAKSFGALQLRIRCHIFTDAQSAVNAGPAGYLAAACVWGWLSRGGSWLE